MKFPAQLTLFNEIDVGSVDAASSLVDVIMRLAARRNR